MDGLQRNIRNLELMDIHYLECGGGFMRLSICQNSVICTLTICVQYVYTFNYVWLTEHQFSLSKAVRQSSSVNFINIMVINI